MELIECSRNVSKARETKRFRAERYIPPRIFRELRVSVRHE
jgi:hypothetical protein